MADFLEESHESFIDAFEGLPENAQCLYVRFANRKGRVFLRDYLRYDEIPSIPEALTHLETSEFARAPREDDWTDLLCFQTRPELIALARAFLSDPFRSNIKKRDLVSLLREQASFSECFPGNALRRFVVQEQ
mgnify:FL=1